MTMTVKKTFTLTLMAAMLLLVRGVFAQDHYDIVIYGGTVGGVSAAIQAGRMGASVILIEPSHHLGGMTTSGLGATDIGSKTSIGGIAREFYGRIYTYYQDPAVWTNQTREEYAPKHADSITESLKTQ